jgi:transcriptional regulator with XRE-family HTH domain
VINTVTAKEAGEVLQTLRKKHNLTQQGLSLAAGFNDQGGLKLPLETVTRLERGIMARPTMEDLVIYGGVLHLTPNDVAEIYGYWERPGEPLTELSQAFEAAKLLDEEMQRYVVQVVNGTLAVVEEQRATNAAMKAIKKK